jgi:1-acyl-sn-glycerol-3-phosphate acyltransferase
VVEAGQLGPRDRLALAVQRAVGRLLSPVWVPATVALMRFGLGWRIADAARARREYRHVWRLHEGPLLVCANHLTLIDSAIIAWALGSWTWFLAHYASLPWNVPERRNFSSSLGSRVLVYLMRCVPVERGGDRNEVAGVLARLEYLLRRGEAVLLFPEGGRSRTGRVDVENVTYGVGRVIAALPGCRVLCVYLRGEHQDEFSDLPARGERFHVRLTALQPTSAMSGMRAQRDLSQQVVHTLADLEREYFQERTPGLADARQ